MPQCGSTVAFHDRLGERNGAVLFLHMASPDLAIPIKDIAINYRQILLALNVRSSRSTSLSISVQTASKPSRSTGS